LPHCTASSKFLQYRSTAPPELQGLDGVYVLSLARRQDRLRRFVANTTLDPQRLHLQQAFDGRELTWSAGLERLFRSNKFGRARGVVGKCLSHFLLWRHIAQTADQFHLILEDDVEFAPYFVQRWNTEMRHAFPPRAKIVYLGGMIEGNRRHYRSATRRVSRHFNEHVPTTLFSHSLDEGVDAGTSTDASRAFHYRSYAYVLSSQGAKELVQFVADHGFVQVGRPAYGLELDGRVDWASVIVGAYMPSVIVGAYMPVDV